MARKTSDIEKKPRAKKTTKSSSSSKKSQLTTYFEKMHKCVIPERLCKFDPFYNDILRPRVFSDGARERFIKVLNNYKLLTESSSEDKKQSLCAFNDSLYELYSFIKESFEDNKEYHQRKVKEYKSIDYIRIEQHLNNIDSLYNKEKYNLDQPDILTYIAKTIWTHIYILVEGDLRLSEGPGTYVYELEKNK